MNKTPDIMRKFYRFCLSIQLVFFSLSANAQKCFFTITQMANNYYSVDRFYDGFARVTQSEILGQGFIDTLGREVVPCHYIDVSRNAHFCEGLALLRKKVQTRMGKSSMYGYVDRHGKTIIPFIYKEAWNLHKGHAFVMRDGQWGVLDKTGKVLIPFAYSRLGVIGDGLILAERHVGEHDFKIGVIDGLGQEILPIVYDHITSLGEGWILAEKDGEKSLLDMKSTRKVKVDHWTHPLSVSEGILCLWNRVTTGCGYLNLDNGKEIPAIYVDAMDFHNGFAVVKKDGFCGIIDKDGRQILPMSYDYIMPYRLSMGFVVKKNGKMGVIDNGERVVIPCVFDDLSFAGDGPIAAKKDGKWGFVDKDGDVVIPFQFDACSDFNDGVAIVTKGEKEGIIDKSGKMIVPFVCESILGFSCGLSLFKLGGRYGYMDRNGSAVIPPIFNRATGFNESGHAVADNLVISLKGRESRFLEFDVAAEQGYADAQYFRSRYCFLSNNTVEGLKWLRKASDSGLSIAQRFLGNCYLNGSFVEKDLAEGMKLQLAAAEHGNLRAQAFVGQAFAKGEIVSKNYPEAYKWTRLAANGGQEEAVYNLGLLYESGLGVERNRRQALELYRWGKDRESGDYKEVSYKAYNRLENESRAETEPLQDSRVSPAKPDSSHASNVGGGTDNKTTTSRNLAVNEISAKESQKVADYRKDAEQGDAIAQERLGRCYYLGDGVARDYSEAVKWFRKSAEQGHAAGQVNLGLCYRKGEGVEKDDIEAMKWYLKAADQGSRTGQYNYGRGLLLGLGAAVDEAEGVKWLTKSAEKGYPDAQYLLGKCYMDGTGVTKNYDTALKWFEKAARQGQKNAPSRIEQLKTLMESEQTKQ